MSGVRPLVCLVIALLGCGPNRPAPNTPAPEPTALVGRLVLSRFDPREPGGGGAWSISVTPDGRYDGEYTWSAEDTSFRSSCGGTRPVSEVEPWFHRAQAEATLQSAPRPALPEGRYGYAVILAHEAEDGTLRYFPKLPDQKALGAWAEGFVGGCL